MKKIVKEYTASGKAYYVEINEEDYRFFIYNQYNLGKITKEELYKLKNDYPNNYPFHVRTY